MSQTIMDKQPRPLNSKRGKTIKQAREEKKISQEEFGKQLGVSKQMVSAIEKGAKFSPQVAAKIQQVTGLNITWLLLDEGEAYPTEIFENNNFEEGNARIFSPNHTELLMPFIPIKAHASFVEHCSDFQKLDVEHIRVYLDNAPKNGIVIEVDGDSMYPVLKHQSRVVAVPIPKADWVYMNAGIYAISYASKFVIKSVRENNLKREGFLRLYSENTTHGYEDALFEEIRCIYECVEIVSQSLKR